jgi:hypothetical protein
METQTAIGIVIKRLTLIKGLILLEEFEEVSSHLKKLNGMTDDAAVKEIADDPPEADYSDAVGKIEKFITDRQKITVYEASTSALAGSGNRSAEN